MAYRGNQSNDGGCLASIIVFFVLVFLPAWVTGDDFGWGVLIIWWIILAFICWIVYECCKPQSPITSDYSQRDSTKNTSSEVSGYGHTGLTLSKNNKSKMLTDKYNRKIEFKRRLEDEVKNLSDSIGKIKVEIDELNKRNEKIRTYAEKPLLMSKKKYMSKMSPEINDNTENIKVLEEKIGQMRQQIEGKQSIISTTKFVLHEESNQEFETLKKAFESFKKSCKVEGSIGIKGSAISSYQRDKDLSFIDYKIQPYGLSLGGDRFYIFPASVWVYEGENNLVGIFKPKVIEAKFEHRENIKYSYRTYADIADDTKIITKDIPHTTWLHTCRDGSPDLRYSHNPRRTYYTQQEYYLECSFELILCGYSLKYKVSSYDNCEMLQKAIKKYSVVKENVDIIPTILNLLERCTDGTDVAYINKKIMGN